VEKKRKILLRKPRERKKRKLLLKIRVFSRKDFAGENLICIFLQKESTLPSTSKHFTTENFGAGLSLDAFCRVAFEL